MNGSVAKRKVRFAFVLKTKVIFETDAATFDEAIAAVAAEYPGAEVLQNYIGGEFSDEIAERWEERGYKKAGGYP